MNENTKDIIDFLKIFFSLALVVTVILLGFSLDHMDSRISALEEAQAANEISIEQELGILKAAGFSEAK